MWHDGPVAGSVEVPGSDSEHPAVNIEDVDPNKDGDELRDACGVFGVYAPGRPVAFLTYDGLYALQHRGQESAGMAVSDGESVTVVRDMGLVSNVFDERTLTPLQGDLAIGHTRYSTTGSSTWRNAQPVFRPGPDGSGFALGHNGNLTNTAQLAEDAGMLPGTVGSDSDLVAELVARAAEKLEVQENALERSLVEVLPSLAGAYSFVAMDTSRIIGVRDPNGFRPLCLGRLENGWALASESPALDIIGAHFVREIEPGEMVVIDETGIRSVRPFDPERVNPKLCIFEFVYLARPDSQLYGKEIHGARRRMGELLAEQAPVPPSDRYFDRPIMVMGVPESGVPAAEGYALRSGHPLGQGLVKNRYIGRTFIAPSQEARARGVRRKFNPLRDNVVGKRLVIIDDSIVRGTTSRALVNMMREAGAVEVHMRVSSPPYKWPCFYGIDTGTRAELLGANLDLEEMRKYLMVDSLGFLSLANLKAAIAAPGAGLCDACLTGNYPVEVPLTLNKGVLEDEPAVKIS
jgi:amidophosphoribosyltransferase